MEEKKNVELKVRKKSDWSIKKVLTTIIIAVLALLMVGGLSYVIALIQGSTDESNVFGKYDGKPIKYEANTVFYNSLNSSADYQNAVVSGDFNAIYNSWAQAYQSQVLYVALNDLALKSGVKTTDRLVDKLIINSGVYASEDGTKTFDESVYNSVTNAEKSSTFNYFKNLYPYYVIINDYQTVAVSEAEKDFISSLAADTRTFEYFVVGADVYPDGLASSYDITEMPAVLDEEGNPTDPTLSQIKQYILSKEPELVKPYIESAVAEAATMDFYTAADKYSNGVVSIDNAINNIGGSAYMFNGVENADPQGYVAASLTDDLAKTLFTEAEGKVLDPITYGNVYVFVRISSVEKNDSACYLVGLMVDYYSATTAVNDLANTVLSSEKFEDNFVEKFMPILFGSMAN